MELTVFLPTLLLAVAFAASVLLYSVQKVFGPGVLSFRNKAQVGSDSGNSPGNSPSHGSEAPPSYECLLNPALSPGLDMRRMKTVRIQNKMLSLLAAAGHTHSQDGGEVAVPMPKSAILDQLSVGLTVASYQWSNLTLTVRDKMTGKLKKLLHGCTGTALSGDLVALMGPSGTSNPPFKLVCWLRPLPLHPDSSSLRGLARAGMAFVKPNQTYGWFNT